MEVTNTPVGDTSISELGVLRKAAGQSRIRTLSKLSGIASAAKRPLGKRLSDVETSQVQVDVDKPTSRARTQSVS